MAKGKYAAKAAGQRATAAAETVETLKAQLAEERKTRAAESADLKTQIQQIAGRLTREVNDLAGAEIARAQSEARELIEAERAERHAKNLEAYRFLLTLDLNLDTENGFNLCALLGLDPGEAISNYQIPRYARRLSGDQARHALSKLEQDLATGAPRLKQVRSK
jgi:hypothetical protein